MSVGYEIDPPTLAAGLVGDGEELTLDRVQQYDEWGWNLKGNQVVEFVNAHPGARFHIILKESQVT